MRNRRYISPKGTRAIIDLAKLAWPLMMRLKHGGIKLRIVGDGLQRFQLLKNERVVICPNHSSDDDAEVIFGLSRILKEDFYFLTAHEIFHGNHGLNRLFLPRLGCYSIERGTNDVSAYRTTRDLLVANQHKLVVFPEGEISHFNEFVMPLERGVVQMSFAAMNHLRSINTPGNISILPIAIRYFLSEDASEQLENAMDRIEKKLELFRLENQTSADRVRRSLLQFVSTLERRFDVLLSSATDFATRMTRLRWAILKRVASRLNVKLNENESQIECAHRIKSQLCDCFYHHESVGAVQFTVAELKSLYKELCFAIDLIAVEHSLLARNYDAVSQDDIYEVVELLETALFKNATLDCSKLILIAIGEPLCLGDYYDQYTVDRRATVKAIDEKIRTQLTSIISDLTQAYLRQTY
ncbi:MAG: 1-acyl-sn-glycerol-3-phosphate acyltransferase [Candidatus Obscuribacterales bacterium]|nr:1-acyl-sn-glycerol-3-phosphate acyltransferase [Candidatus Obscuribacterales bacterium]